MPKWREREREREKTFILALPETNAGEGCPVVGGRPPRGTGTTGGERAGERLREGGGFNGGELR
jgi:hypothetical protein